MKYIHLLALSGLVLLLAACGGESTDQPALSDTYDSSGIEAGLAVISEDTLHKDTATLADDYMEGRGTGTVGEERAIEHIRDRMIEAGLEGGAPDGTFFQEVPLLGSTPIEVSDLVFTNEDGTSASFTFFDDFIISTDLDTDSASLEGGLVFVGYGITNPGYDWDDYGNVDVSGKIIVSLVNDPPATADEPNLFEADTLTYNGRWTYKYEEARRRGARGAILIHTDELAGYPFQVLQSGARGEDIQLATPPENPLELKGWIIRPVAERLAELAGSSFDEWLELAASRDFQAIELPVEVSVSATFESRYFSGTNVIGRIAGADRPNEVILYTAHHDHLGIDHDLIAAGQDGIYNGAVDNATGVAMLLNIAEAFSALENPPARSIYFASVTAEESGLLGSQYYAENLGFSPANVIANINVDSGNLHGETTDIVGIGAERSKLIRYFTEAAEAEGLTVSPDQLPGQGLYFRSDQLSFARVGVPGVFVNTGRHFVGQPDDYAARIAQEYNQNHYHQPSDELRDYHTFYGLAQQTRVAFRLGHHLATTSARPAWRPSEAFAETRAATERESRIR